MDMERYKNLGGNSGVEAFKVEDQSIAVKFFTGGSYLYDADSPGLVHIEKMKQLAEDGEGLNGYINKKVKKNYARKLN